MNSLVQDSFQNKSPSRQLPAIQPRQDSLGETELALADRDLFKLEGQQEVSANRVSKVKRQVASLIIILCIQFPVFCGVRKQAPE